MSAKGRCRAALFTSALLLLTGCARAPAFDILGSFFPAWLLCLTVGLLLTFLMRWVFLRLGIVIAVPVLTFPSLMLLFACTMWLVFFR